MPQNGKDPGLRPGASARFSIFKFYFKDFKHFDNA